MGFLRSLGNLVFGSSDDDSHDSGYHNCECYGLCDGNCYSCRDKNEFDDDYDYNNDDYDY